MNRNESKYYYSIMWNLDQLPRNEGRLKLKMLHDSIGKDRVTRQRYYLKKSKNRVSMSVEESHIYQKVLELESTHFLLSSYSKEKEKSIFDKFGYDNY